MRKGCGFDLGNILTLLLYLLLKCSFGFLNSLSFNVAASNQTSFEFVKVARCCLLGFQNKFDWDDKFFFSRLFTEDKVLWVPYARSKSMLFIYLAARV